MWNEFRKARAELLIPLTFLGLIAYAESVLALASLSAGMVIHIMTLFTLIAVSSIIYSWKPKTSQLLASLVLVPLIRIFSISTPYWPFSDNLVWLGVMTFPMLVAAFSTIYVQSLKRSDYGFVLGGWKNLPVQVGIILLGVPLGVLEYFILTPSPWISEITPAALMFGGLVILLGTGVAEELIFRGIILHNSSLTMDQTTSIVYVSLLFAAMHIGFVSLPDLLLVFLIGLFFAYAACRTKSLLGVIGCHSLLNMILYLAAPYIF
ncbi:MAG: lysostaphin resistance A-like protein [Thermoplasmata archaeon]